MQRSNARSLSRITPRLAVACCVIATVAVLYISEGTDDRREQAVITFGDTSDLCREVLLTWECMLLEQCLKEHPVAEIKAWMPSGVWPSCEEAIKPFECAASDTCALANDKRKGLVPGDIVARSQVQGPNGRVPFVAVRDRTPTPFPPPCRQSGDKASPSFSRAGRTRKTKCGGWA